MAAGYVNDWQQMLWAQSEFHSHLTVVAFCRIIIVLCFLAYSYAVGAVIWCLITAARWINSVSASGMLRIQPGHSDNCCGFEGVGNCCLQSAISVLIGMALCLSGSNSEHVIFFRTYWNEAFIKFIVPFSYVIMVGLFVVACALVFLSSFRRLHLQLKSYKTQRELAFTRSLEHELSNIEESLLDGNNDQLKAECDRIKLVQVLDPAVLKLATWPFDRASLVKYGVTPCSIPSQLHSAKKHSRHLDNVRTLLSTLGQTKDCRGLQCGPSGQLPVPPWDYKRCAYLDSAHNPQQSRYDARHFSSYMVAFHVGFEP